MNAPIDRLSPFWERCFAIAFETLARREALTSKTLAGPKLAEIARMLADDCERARRADDQRERCPRCGGPGCEACRYTGKADPGAGLRAPQTPLPTIPITSPPPLDPAEALDRGCTCPDWPNAIHPPCPIHGPPRMADDPAPEPLPEVTS